MRLPARHLVAAFLTIAAAASASLADVIYYSEEQCDPPYHSRIVRNLESGAYKQVVVDQDARVFSIALHTGAGKLYWGSHDSVIRRANLDGSDIEVIVPAPEGRAWDLEIEVSGGKIYWHSAGEIQRADLDGSNVETVLDPDLYLSGGIAPHGPTGKLYYAGFYIADNDVYYQIRRANLDGTDDELLLERPKWLDLSSLELDADYPGTRVYWVQWDEDNFYDIDIAAMELDGLFYEPLGLGGLLDSHLAVTSSRIYWNVVSGGEPPCGPGKIYRGPLDGSGKYLLFSMDGNSWAIDVDDTSDSIPVPAVSNTIAGLLVFVFLALSSALMLRRRREG